MTKRMRGNDKMHVMRSVLFGEPLDIWDFMSSVEDPHSKFPVSRTDPNVMFEVFKQNYHSCNSVNLRMTKVALEIEMAFPLYQQGEERIMTDIPNREGVEYDPIWVAKFAKLFFKKRVHAVTVGMLRGSDHNYLDMIDDYIVPIIKQIDRSTPPNNWKTAVEDKNRSIYMDPAPNIDERKWCRSIFLLVSHYSLLDERFYVDFT